MDYCLGLKLSDQAAEITIPKSMSYILRKVRGGERASECGPERITCFCCMSQNGWIAILELCVKSQKSNSTIERLFKSNSTRYWTIWLFDSLAMWNKRQKHVTFAASHLLLYKNMCEVLGAKPKSKCGTIIRKHYFQSARQDSKS